MVALRLLPTSPRRRRRLAWTAGSLAAVVVVATAVVLLPRGEAVPQTALRTAPEAAAPPQPKFRLTPARRREVDALVRRFAREAATRQDPAGAWNDASAAMHAGVSRQEWDAGNLPGVVPFDADALHGVSWRVVYREPDRVGLDVLLVPRLGSQQRTIVYAADIVFEHDRLVIDSWAPRESFGGAPKARKTGETAAAPAEPSFARGRLDARWLLVPAGVLGLAILVPLGLVVRNIVRNRRAYRHYERAHRD
jgi:hypothetical protein